eukprot:233196-Chlamydomonas_euryale.AAC.1
MSTEPRAAGVLPLPFSRAQPPAAAETDRWRHSAGGAAGRPLGRPRSPSVPVLRPQAESAPPRTTRATLSAE